MNAEFVEMNVTSISLVQMMQYVCEQIIYVHVNTMIGLCQTLLDLGASPNYKDGRGLTPLYHTVTRESRAGPQCVQMLLHDRAEIGSYDEDGNTELHQVSMNNKYYCY